MTDTRNMGYKMMFEVKRRQNTRCAGIMYISLRNINYAIFLILFISCNSLPKNVSQEEYNYVRDYVSLDISGLPYFELCERFKNQSPPQYYYPNEGLPYYTETPGSDFSKYNEYIIKISNEMGQLMSGYKRTDQAENFCLWAIRTYNSSDEQKR